MRDWLKQHKQQIFRVTTTLVVVGLFVFVAPEANAAPSILNDPVLWFASILAWFVNALVNIVSSILVKILQIFQVVLQYDDFITHPVVRFGWEIVRNLANTGLVAIMLIIAFMTMFGIGKVQWQQQIPRLIIAAIAVNFSRLITGIFIDIGQVIMNAFVNALQQVGYANFFEMLQLRQQTQFAGNPTGLAELGAALTLLGTSVFALAQAVIALIVVMIMLAVLVYRVVILWVLIVMSPAAFAAGAAQGMLSKAGDYYGQWWGKLTAAVMIGPILAFFLWLSLASVSGSGLAEDFNPPAGSDAPSIIASESAEVRNLLAYVIGIALLLAGLEIASGTAQTLGGFASKAVSSGSGLSKKIAGAPIALAGSAAIGGARLGVRGAKKLGRAGIQLADDKAFSQKRADFKRYASKRLGTYADRAIAGGGLGVVSGAAAKALGGRLSASEEAQRKRLQKEESGFGKTMSLQERMQFIEKNGKSGDARVQSRVSSLRAAIAGDKDQIGSLLETNPEQARKMIKDAQDHYKSTGQDKEAEALEKRMKTDMRLGHGDSDSMKSALEGMSDKDLKGLSADNFKDANFRKAMADSGALGAFFSGSAQEQKEAQKGYSKAFIAAARQAQGASGADAAEAARHQRETDRIAGLPADQREAATRSNNALRNLSNAANSDSMKSALGAGLNLGDIDIASLQANGNFDANAFKGMILEVMRQSNGATSLQQLKETAANGSGAEQTRAQQTMDFVNGIHAQNNVNLLDERERLGGVTDATRANRAVLGGTQGRGDLSGYGYNATNGQFGSESQRRQFRAAAGKTPSIILNMENHLSANGGNNEAARAIAQSFDKTALNGLMEQFEKSRGGAQEGMYRKMIEQVGKVIEQQSSIVDDTDALSDQLKEAQRHFKSRIRTQI